MRIPRNVAVARTVALLAVVSAPAYVWLGWWQLAVSFLLALVAGFLAPRRPRRPRTNSLRAMIARRLDPHPWRPGPR